ncbi:hypothetical protein GCM10022254_48940 [Actinomadura meridiana]|uniref:N-acetyltransferase domain-containing protein n=1 Tax=Actinomadura meridiana TaxID=559626 RepID=A0ABP8CC69_9ACTN
MSDSTFVRRTGDQALAMLGDLTDLYLDVRSQGTYRDDPLFSRAQFMARTEDQARRPGFELVTVHADHALAGFSFGLPFSSGRWWAGAEYPPDNILEAAKFAVIELDVGRAHQGRGLGKALLGELLSGRSEKNATLAAIPESAAHAMYERWGWRKVGIIGGEGPMMDAMVLALPVTR